ncbi:hypothetical protein AURDEDRAFT_164921 [Auricularia subglabra TFB-10046 SS5]|nr:hypothetical protein AURDEDRAFT_164921 [Auricularia subglabra TFB-10046 SS5]
MSRLPDELVAEILAFLDVGYLRTAAAVSRQFYASAWRAGLYIHLKQRWGAYGDSYSALLAIFKEIVRHVLQILAFLDVGYLRTAAAVSRQFYASAWRAGLYIHLKQRWGAYGDSYSALLAIFKEIVRHVLRKGLRLSISLTLDWHARVGDYLLRVFALVADSLPVLVYLSVDMGLLSPSLLVSALRLPAPNLQQLILTGLGNASRPAEELPVDILSGGAPKLRYLELRDVSLPPRPIPACSRVDSVRLKYTDLYPNVAFAQHFPQMRRLFLEFDTHTQHPAPESFNLEG